MLAHDELGHESGTIPLARGELRLAHVTPLCNSRSKLENEFYESRLHVIVIRVKML